ncbi:hypothetical protein Ade02nite_08950 [Paractinoplanes deccanensis]|uniref:Histidine kinase/HSP90-like ATPase domain-containing protein n=1 Tax=Paractinoplanes deccanensis TaxID=113561 RepID=A0ABQ3XX08_9ACTN|nr:ATP-binding protein [Actinoplanes deccanensis]GID72254.1 hypothetical protein Ade02nite_08950 [Actinoplanes deccanensis]
MTEPPDHDRLHRDFTLGSLVALRHEIEQWAGAHGLTGLVLYRFVVAVNEITTNAVRHGGGHGHVRLWRAADGLHCTVTDRGAGLPAGVRPRAPLPDAVGGRGLWLARHGTDEFTLRSGPRGTAVSLALFTHAT